MKNRADPSLKSKEISIYFPKREELSFLPVFALPNDSRTTFDLSKMDLTLSI